MVRLYPELTTAQLNELQSKAEAVVYKCLKDNLKEDYIVIHSKSYVAISRAKSALYVVGDTESLQKLGFC